MKSVNRMAIELADEALDFAEDLNLGVRELASGATVMDFGVERAGGVEAGLLLSELQTAGLATVQTRMDELGGAPLPHVELSTDSPALSLLCSQKAGWELSVDGFEGLGSGPARALVAEEAEFRELGYTDAFDLTVLSVEAEELPGDAVAEHVAERADVNPEGVYLMAYSTGSLAGSVSGAARAAESAVYRLFEAGYDPEAVRSASASAPVAPIAGDEETAIGRTSDAVVYGGRVHLVVQEDDEVLREVASTAAEEYGVPSAEIFADADWAFDEVEPGVFGPAQVTVDVAGGPTHVVGEVHEDVLAESYELA
jgi:methenyltetrahydromethanopterin cyclohydrolase